MKIIKPNWRWARRKFGIQKKRTRKLLITDWRRNALTRKLPSEFILNTSELKLKKQTFIVIHNSPSVFLSFSLLFSLSFCLSVYLSFFLLDIRIHNEYKSVWTLKKPINCPPKLRIPLFFYLSVILSFLLYLFLSRSFFLLAIIFHIENK